MSAPKPARRIMRVPAVLTEAWLNIASGTTRATLLAIIAGLVLAGLATADIRTIVGLSNDATLFRDSGASIYLVTAAGKIDGARCEALGTIPGVEGAGATRQSATEVQFLTAPRAGITTVDATVGLARVLGIDERQPAGIWLSVDASATLGASTGTVLPTSGGTVPVAATYGYGQDASVRTLAHAAVTPVPPAGAFDACWVKMWPYSETTQNLITSAFVGGLGDDMKSSQLNSKLGATFDGPDLFAGRATALVPFVAVGFGLVLGFVSLRLRRLEIAGALHARVPKRALLAQTMLETAVVAVVAIIVALPLTYFAAAYDNPEPLWSAWASGLRILAVGAISLILGGLVSALLTSEKRLFRYFKDR